MSIKLIEELIDEIGEYLGFEMWNKRDKTKEYDFPGSREADALPGDYFVSGNLVQWYNRPTLLVYQYEACRYDPFFDRSSLYTLNLSTMKPTKNSSNQTPLSQELIEKLKANPYFHRFSKMPRNKNG